MDSFSFKGMPKFKTPEEELDFLRAHVAEKEKALIDAGHFEHAQEKAITHTISEYKKMPLEAVVHSEHAISENDTEGIVLKLKPETHDIVMEELLGLLLTKGIRNALSVVQSMNNPHIDDDFHRLLIQYLKTGQIISGLKEGTPLWKELHMTLFEVTLPPAREDSEKSKGFKEFIGAMEQFYAGMHSIAEDPRNLKENYFTLEIALSSSSDEVVIYAGIPNKHVSMFEKQVLAFYQDAKVVEVSDDYNIFNDEGVSAGAYAAFLERPVLPIKTYEAIDHDPMN
ncbi:MAG: hypothetical protein ACK4FA_01450, partial [Candidatus Paceibacteria bacterium]